MSFVGDFEVEMSEISGAIYFIKVIHVSCLHRLKATQRDKTYKLFFHLYTENANILVYISMFLRKGLNPVVSL